MDDEVEDVRVLRMEAVGPQGERVVVEAKQDGRWIKLLEDGTRGQAERVAADARRGASPRPSAS